MMAGIKLDSLLAGVTRGVEQVQTREADRSSDKAARLARAKQALQAGSGPAPTQIDLPTPTTGTIATLATTHAPASSSEAPAPALTPPHEVARDAEPRQSAEITGSPQFVHFCRRHNYTPGQTIKWPIDKIDSNPDNPRFFYDENSIKGLAVSVASTGLGEAVKVTVHETEPDRVVLWDGERRLRAAKNLNETTIDVKIDDLKSPLERYLAGRALNTERDGQTCLDDAVAWKRLLDKNHVRDQNELADLVQVKASEVSMTLKVGEMPSEVLVAMATKPPTSHDEAVEKEQKFGLSMAYEIYRYFTSHGLEKTLTLVRRIKEKDLSVVKVREIIRSEADGEGPKRRQRYDQRHEFKVGDSTHGSIKMYGDDSLKLELSSLKPEKREDLYKQIKELVTRAIQGE